MPDATLKDLQGNVDPERVIERYDENGVPVYADTRTPDSPISAEEHHKLNEEATNKLREALGRPPLGAREDEDESEEQVHNWSPLLSSPPLRADDVPLVVGDVVWFLLAPGEVRPLLVTRILPWQLVSGLLHTDGPNDHAALAALGLGKGPVQWVGSVQRAPEDGWSAPRQWMPLPLPR